MAGRGAARALIGHQGEDGGEGLGENRDKARGGISHRGISLSSLKLLRVPFALLLAPTFLWAWVCVPHADWGRTLFVFFTLHLFLYPASHAYNSFYDRDEESIGGLEKPPTVTPELIYLARGLDLAALLSALILGWKVFVIALAYTLCSKAYSYPGTRWKAKPWLSWLVVSLFQGAGAFFMAYFAMDPSGSGRGVWLPAAAASLLIAGSYPLTQVYQHREDSKRGDLTLSLLLGVRGTFLFSGATLTLAVAAMALWAHGQGGLPALGILLASMTPALVFFIFWTAQVLARPSEASFVRLSWMNRFSAIGLSVFLVGTMVLRAAL